MSSTNDFDLQIISAQRRELMAAKAIDSDLKMAFDLQLQEAITASLAHLPSTSNSNPPQGNIPQTKEELASFTDFQSDELLRLEQELEDQMISEAEFRKLQNDLHIRLHDRSIALEISRMPDAEWQDWGDNFERPFGEGSSKGVTVSDEIFRVYFKGLVEMQNEVTLGGIGIAICDSRDDLLFELRKPLANNLTKQRAEFCALIEGLNAALSLELKRVLFYCDYHPTFNYVNRMWAPKQQNVLALVNKVFELQKKFVYCQPFLVARNDVKFAFRLAREAIDSQFGKCPAESSGSNYPCEQCVICLEDTSLKQIFVVENCSHRYCFSCMKQHVEVKLLHGMMPTCPHEGCKTELKIDHCRIFLTPKLIEIMNQRIEEALIPVREKVYCPYPKCSALMSRRDVLKHSKTTIKAAETFGARQCMKCKGYFCVDCKVPWHQNMTCLDYKRRHPYPQVGGSRLKNLAATKMWRQCVKCNHMIELDTGCYHITCRCGYEFCYTCGAGWRNKKATCSCPLWDEHNLLDDRDEE